MSEQELSFHDVLNGYGPDNPPPEPDPQRVERTKLLNQILANADELDAESREMILHALDNPIGPDEALTEAQRHLRLGCYGMTDRQKGFIRDALRELPDVVGVNAFTVPTKDGKERPMSAFEFSRYFKRKVRPYGKNDARELVTYKDGLWSADDDWLYRNLLNGLGDYWTVERRNSYVRALNDAGQVVPMGKEEYLNFGNTLVHWRTGNAVDHSPEDCGTVQLGTVWDPEAKCPRWRAFVAGAVAPDAVGFLQELFGYMLYVGGNPFRASFMLHGPTGSGKSVTLTVLSGLVGDGNISNRALQELSEDRFATANLFGKLVNLCGDIDSTMLRQTATFKQITGGDVISAQEKGQRAFSFRPICKLIFSANKLPGSVDVSTAWFTRWHLIEFPNGGHTRTEGFEEGLLEELPGIAVWAVEGLQRLMARGGFDQPESVKAAGEAYRREVDSVAAWLATQEIYTTGAPVPGSACYVSYAAFCDLEGRKPVSRLNFYSRLKELDCERVEKWNGTAVYYRIRSKTEGLEGSTF